MSRKTGTGKHVVASGRVAVKATTRRAAASKYSKIGAMKNVSVWSPKFKTIR